MGDTTHTTAVGKIDSVNFYSNYYGHPAKDLQTILTSKPRAQPAIYLVGDSTLDNKHWLPARAADVHPNPLYNRLLDGVEVRRDVAYWLCKEYVYDGDGDGDGDIDVDVEQHASPTIQTAMTRTNVAAFLPVNCAVEATTVRARNADGLFAQDALVRDHVTREDVVIASLGGNDIALAPTPRIALSALRNVYLGGESGLSALCTLFDGAITQYLETLLETCRPRLLIVCMLYFPAEAVTASWAGLALRLLAYNVRPMWLQAAFRRVFRRAVSQIRVAGVRVVAVPFYDVLDGKHGEDYVARVEPSEEGGRKMAQFLKQVIDRELLDMQSTDAT